VTVNVDDLEAAVGPDGGDGQPRGSATGTHQTNRDRAAAGGAGSVSAIRLDRVRSVASSLDVRGARVEEALELLGRYLDDASLAGLDKVLIIHGLGTGALRDAVREVAGAHPLVKSVRPGERGEGGDGATIVTL